MTKCRIDPVGMALWLTLATAVGCSGGGGGGGSPPPPPPEINITFHDEADADPAVTTAAWAMAGEPGLVGLYGFEGDGREGALDVVGHVVLDSSGAGALDPDADGVVEWCYTSLTIRRGGRLQLVGAHPIRLRVVGVCSILGTLDASGWNGANAPAGTASQVGVIPGGAGGPGGGAGGPANARPNATLGALPVDLRGGPGFPGLLVRCGEPSRSDNRQITVLAGNCGGGMGGNRGGWTLNALRSGCSGNGGGHWEPGVMTDHRCENVQAFGRSFGEAWAQPASWPLSDRLTAGAGGGGGGNAAIAAGNPPPRDDIVAGSGGGGGGGFEILGGSDVVVGNGGVILANGGNGGTGFSTLVSATTVSGGYGGGGAGGSIWLSGVSVSIEPGATVMALGGRGNPSPPAHSLSGQGGKGYLILRDTGGNPFIRAGANVDPGPISGRNWFKPEPDGKTQAVSRWYDGGSAQPNWQFTGNDPVTGAARPGDDLVYEVPPKIAQFVWIEFQAAPDKGGVPDPDPSRWHPSGNTTTGPYSFWETDLAKVRAAGDFRWLRFRVRFELYHARKYNPPYVNRVVIRSLHIRG